MTNFWKYTCTGCKEELDPYELDEFGHTCNGWWDDHSIFDEVPKILVESATGEQLTIQANDA